MKKPCLDYHTHAAAKKNLSNGSYAVVRLPFPLTSFVSDSGEM
jgi:hypothetical protein